MARHEPCIAGGISAGAPRATFANVFAAGLAVPSPRFEAIRRGSSVVPIGARPSATRPRAPPSPRCRRCPSRRSSPEIAHPGLSCIQLRVEVQWLRERSIQPGRMGKQLNQSNLNFPASRSAIAADKGSIVPELLPGRGRHVREGSESFALVSGARWPGRPGCVHRHLPVRPTEKKTPMVSFPNQHNEVSPCIK